jgi:hypothetical protein
MKFLSDVYPISPDIVLLSFEGVPYPAHSVRLEVHSRILDIAEPVEISATAPSAETQLETRQLGEPRDVLELLLRFMYPHAQPVLKDKPFTHVVAMVNAVERYDVFAATSMCEEALRCNTLLDNNIPLSSLR